MMHPSKDFESKNTCDNGSLFCNSNSSNQTFVNAQNKPYKEEIAILLSVQADFLYYLIGRIEKVEEIIELYQTEHQMIKDRLTYLEYDLHAEVQRLRDENFGLRLEPNYSSEEYTSKEDSFE